MVFMSSCPCLFFLSTLTRISMSGICSTCAIKWQCLSCSRSTFKTWLLLCVPLLSSYSAGNSSLGSFLHISLLALLCGARVLLSRKWHYTEAIHSSSCVGWEEHLFSLMITGTKYLECFFFLSQVLMVPMPSNVPVLAIVEFHSSASGVFSDSEDTFTSWVSPDHGWGASVPSEGHRPGCCAALTLSKALCTVSEHSIILKLRCWKTEIPRTMWVIQKKWCFHSKEVVMYYTVV